MAKNKRDLADTGSDQVDTDSDLADTGSDQVDTDSASYTVAPGKALTSRRGILAEGAEIAAGDLPGGQTAIDAFVESGHIVKNAGVNHAG